ncbi:recombination protein RecR [Candidatus Saccharibacteria bacterium RIFCSPHIGHO2_12_FULL_47_16b]|nr:MAG: recombination protein RecR [Candidatus Saccharibacteria bacterium RIFCSPHIGHO2_12_FULL_47_16b]OGL40256.1 MAG: recombination protein RecR [Candidatus Saccharibacteria bacterium RIFCSPLOWO2_02_FULL_46_7]
MRSVIPPPLAQLIEAIAALPGVGPRTAERYAYFLLKADPAKSTQLASALTLLHAKIKYCPKTFALIDSSQTVSSLYLDPKRDKKLVAVVADPFDIMAIEKTGTFNGTYHVLGGLVSPIEGVDPDQLRIKELIKRVDEDKVSELILATNASVEGESTTLLIAQKLNKRKIKITRLARGLPVGLDLEYADQITLTRALEGRQKI